LDHQDLEADCSRCVGLCCTALQLDRRDGFGHDKLAGTPCHHLDQQSFRCRIHDRLEDIGYEGCEAFDCLGAGQRVTASFAARNFQRDPAVARQMYARFAEMLKLQEMRVAFLDAEALELAPDENTKRIDLLDRLGALADSVETEAGTESAALLIEARALIASWIDCSDSLAAIP
jgi:hypothetical protein